MAMKMTEKTPAPFSKNSAACKRTHVWMSRHGKSFRTETPDSLTFPMCLSIGIYIAFKGKPLMIT
ncbi:hypothetical protein ABD80_05775 [Bacillus atrophaeus]|jgi:hypothetical protein|uniref:Uncharacterized protein n=2 Tax=Bacillus atrophaeus TaxID=1452 RepID=A0ABN3Z891_BACA1|nr:hypothetical protein [Bacillus atrophaeus]ADP31780.1 hypothetical protein BATR1942_04130 [Bacillus atrophaeus 1942]AMR63290.1 hypothetical protein A1D11_13080 [Bacillus subtilis subsp. globigii]EIM10512.1 hypothetical protein UY9_12474 [Bacillus atrophaeus C89]MBG9759310.1 hypothetical protein [Bacillus atrophaeus]MCY8925496.1 hypothetical protein [Bacillus atrophaeus]